MLHTVQQQLLLDIKSSCGSQAPALFAFAVLCISCAITVSAVMIRFVTLLKLSFCVWPCSVLLQAQ
jgi:hypothetical protein